MSKIGWIFEDYEEGSDEIYDYIWCPILAETQEEALQIAKKLVIHSYLDDIKVKRYEEYDQFAELGYVPAEHLYNDFQVAFCEHCDRKVSQLFEPEDEDGWEDLPSYKPNFLKDLAFCCDSCLESYLYLQKEKENVNKIIL